MRWVALALLLIRRSVTRDPKTHFALVDVEADVRAELASELAQYHLAVSSAFGLLGEIVDSGNRRNLPLAAKIDVLLASRLQTDLRAVDLLSTLGYALQATTIASTVREIAVALMYIGGSNDRARDWGDHDKERRSYPQNQEREAEQHRHRHAR